MTIVRVGATKKYSDNWDAIFAGGKRKSARQAAGAGLVSSGRATKKSASSVKAGGKNAAKRAGAKSAAQSAKKKAGRKGKRK